MTQEERDAIRREIYNAVREVYLDLDFFPESYEKATNVGAQITTHALSHFVAVEIWEVMEGQETLEGCREEAIVALRNAQNDLQAVIDALEVF